MINTTGINFSAITSWQNRLTQPTSTTAARQTQQEEQNTPSSATQRNTSDSAPVISQIRNRGVDVLTSLQAAGLSTRVASALSQQPVSIVSDAPALRDTAEKCTLSIAGHDPETDKAIPQSVLDNMNSLADDVRDFLGPAPVYLGEISSDGRSLDEQSKDFLQDKLDKMSGSPVVDLTGNGK